MHQLYGQYVGTIGSRRGGARGFEWKFILPSRPSRWFSNRSFSRNIFV